MTTMANSLSSKHHYLKLLAFLLSLFLGIIVGGVLLGTGWFLVTETPIPSQLSTLLGITAKTPWYISRSAGTVAYLLLAGSTVWGLLLSTKIIKEMLPAALILATHNVLSWLAIAFTGVHALALMFDNYFTYTLPDLTVPLIGPYKPGWVGLGIIGFYLMVITSVSFPFRKQIGQKLWRHLHYLTFAVFILATIHGLMAGTDSIKTSMQALYLCSGLFVFFLTSYRLLTRNTSQLREHQASIGRLQSPN